MRQLSNFWSLYYGYIAAGAGLVAALFTWRFMYNIANMFVNLSETIAEGGFLALAAALVAFGYLYLRARHTIDPDVVFRRVMRRLNSSNAVLDTLGTPLQVTGAKAFITSGGGLRLDKKYTPKLKARAPPLSPLGPADLLPSESSHRLAPDPLIPFLRRPRGCI